MIYKTTTLDTLVTLQRGYDLPAQDRIQGDIPIIAANGPVGFHNVSKVSTQCVVIGRSGSVGNPQLITGPFWPLNTTLFVKDFHGNSPIFVYYVLKTIDFKSFDAGGTVPTLNRNHLTQIKVPLLDLALQELIGGVLHNLDVKIAANNALSKTLGNIAQTIFKSWFIDFDPVKAKMAGEKPVGMDAATAVLFPDSMEESEIGLIPKTWEIKTLGEVVDISWGDTKTTKASYVSSGFKAYSAKGQDGFLKTFDYAEMGIVLSAIGANCGKTWLATGKWSCIKNTMRIIATPNYPEAIPYVYFLTNRSNFWERRGTAQPFIGQEDSRALRILFPDKYLIARFSEVTTPIFDFMNKLSEQTEVLNELRDSLLPRLISGELQIPEEMLAS
jgi:type I restriction enzyme S subunit